MKISRRPEVGLVPVAAICVLSSLGNLCGQAITSRAAPVAGSVIREIDDPANGDRWLLMRNPSNPGGPGRMILAASLNETSKLERGGLASQASAQLHSATVSPAIHIGDRLVIEENTPLVAARLEAVALNPASSGSPLNVRLTIGGKVLRVLALGPGHAAFMTPTEARP